MGDLEITEELARAISHLRGIGQGGTAGLLARASTEIQELRSLACDRNRTWLACNKRLNATEFALEQFVDWFKEPTISEYADYRDDQLVDCKIHIGKFRRGRATLDQNNKRDAAVPTAHCAGHDSFNPECGSCVDAQAAAAKIRSCP